MNLREVLERIDAFPEDAGIYLADASLNATAFVYQAEDRELPEQMEGMRLAMEVWHVQDTLAGLAHLLRQQSGSVDPSRDQLFERFVVYLKNDA